MLSPSDDEFIVCLPFIVFTLTNESIPFRYRGGIIQELHVLTAGRMCLFGSLFDARRSRNPLDELGRDCKYFTMIRNPVSRLVSAFYYCPEDHDQQLRLNRPLKVGESPVGCTVSFLFFLTVWRGMLLVAVAAAELAAL